MYVYIKPLTPYNIRWFPCLQTPVCGQCVLADHSRPEHQYELLEEVESRQAEELQNLVSESQSKLEFCEEATGNLSNALSELQMQRDNARGLIQETFQSYKAILEKQQVSRRFVVTNVLVFRAVCH